jgi:cell division protein FtsQ
MRDYKNVKVPRSYGSKSNRVSIKRARTGRTSVRSRPGGSGIRTAALRIIMVVSIIAGCLLAWQAYRALLHADLFQIAGVDVTGVKQVSEAELRAITGVFTGQNIFSVDLETVARRARANPWVKDVRIYRRLPNRISMAVTERSPYALLDSGFGLYVMDNDGFVIEKISKENASAWQLPVVAIRDHRIRSGEQVTSDSMADALMLIAEIAERGGWRLHDVTIKAVSPETVTILYADHEFRLGAGGYAEKLIRLAEILTDAKQRSIEIAYVDLRPERQAAMMAKQDGAHVTGSRVKGKRR